MPTQVQVTDNSIPKLQLAFGQMNNLLADYRKRRANIAASTNQIASRMRSNPELYNGATMDIDEYGYKQGNAEYDKAIGLKKNDLTQKGFNSSETKNDPRTMQQLQGALEMATAFNRPNAATQAVQNRIEKAANEGYPKLSDMTKPDTPPASEPEPDKGYNDIPNQLNSGTPLKNAENPDFKAKEFNILGDIQKTTDALNGLTSLENVKLTENKTKSEIAAEKKLAKQLATASPKAKVVVPEIEESKNKSESKHKGQSQSQATSGEFDTQVIKKLTGGTETITKQAANIIDEDPYTYGSLMEAQADSESGDIATAGQVLSTNFHDRATRRKEFVKENMARFLNGKPYEEIKTQTPLSIEFDKATTKFSNKAAESINNSSRFSNGGGAKDPGLTMATVNLAGKTPFTIQTSSNSNGDIIYGNTQITKDHMENMIENGNLVKVGKPYKKNGAILQKYQVKGKPSEYINYEISDTENPRIFDGKTSKETGSTFGTGVGIGKLGSGQSNTRTDRKNRILGKVNPNE